MKKSNFLRYTHTHTHTHTHTLLTCFSFFFIPTPVQGAAQDKDCDIYRHLCPLLQRYILERRKILASNYNDFTLTSKFSKGKYCGYNDKKRSYLLFLMSSITSSSHKA